MSENIDWRTKSVAELREVLKNRNLETSGTKAILVARLEVNHEAGECDRMREEIRKLEEEIQCHRNLERGHEEEATGRVRPSPDRYSDRPSNRHPDRFSDRHSDRYSDRLSDQHPDRYPDRHRERASPDRQRKEEFVETIKYSNRRESPTNPRSSTEAGSVQRSTIGDTLLLVVSRLQGAVRV